MIMFIYEKFEQSPCVFSIEVFPPKRTSGGTPESLYPVLNELAELQPDYISVTYGAGGSAAGDDTCQIACYLKDNLNIEPLAHLTCVNADREEVVRTLQKLQQNDVKNILALRGDINPNMPRKTDFLYASDLVHFIHSQGDFNVAGACYPEGHVESPDLTQDLKNMRHKIQAGLSHLVTQLFFDNGSYYRFLNMARKAGYVLPVQAGVMPIVNKRQVQRTIALSSASMPPSLTKILSKYDNDPPSLYEAGIEFAIHQLRDLIVGGADGIHLYAMNNADVARKVYEGISDLLPERNWK